MKLDRAHEFTCTISPEGAVTIQMPDGSNGYGWGPHTTIADEITEALNDIGMFNE